MCSRVFSALANLRRALDLIKQLCFLEINKTIAVLTYLWSHFLWTLCVHYRRITVKIIFKFQNIYSKLLLEKNHLLWWGSGRYHRKWHSCKNSLQKTWNSVQSASTWLQMSSWAQGASTLRLHTAICLYPSRKTGPQSHCCIWCSHLLPTVHWLSPTLERNFSLPSGYEQEFMFILRQVALSCSQTMCLQGWSAIEGIRYTTYSHFLPQLPQEHWGNLGHLPLLLG